MATKPSPIPTPAPVQLARLDQAEFDQLQRKLPSLAVTTATTPTQAAYQLGVAHVLQVLREGWVIGV